MAAVVPAASASHTFALPSETGMGEGNVAYEPDTSADNNGFPDQGFSPSSETLILEGYYGGGTQYPLYVDYNTPANMALHGNDYENWERYIVPGNNFFAAFWGWWDDKGSGGYLAELGAPSNPDGVINDGHDNHTTSTKNPTGTWDEFIWRGVNPWASQHGHQSYDGDVMLTFIQPGTHGTIQTADPYGTPGLSNRADGASTPDFQMSDNTDQGPCTGAPAAGYCVHNKHGGWGNAFGFAGLYYDASLLISTEVTMAVNPGDNGDGTYEISSATAADVDHYSALAPEVETLYRTAVYDPGDKQQTVDIVHDEGSKQYAKNYYTERGYVDTVNGALDVPESVLEPTEPLRGTADDSTGSMAWPHEPNTAGDDFNGHATFDEATSYGGTPYYDPGSNQDYSDYTSGEYPWLDMKTYVGSPTDYGVQVRDYNAYNVFVEGTDRSDASGERTMAPGDMWLAGNFGLWADKNKDEWVGHVTRDDFLADGVDDPTTTPDSSDPYAGGLIDDPNDYDHNSKEAPEGEDPEWRGLCDASVTATLVPDNADQSWGTAGVYVFRDAEAPNVGWNPWDDAVEDVTGDVTVAGEVILDDKDDEQLSHHVTNGPIDVLFNCATTDESGVWLSAEHIILPTGSLEVPVKVTTTATVDDGVKGGWGLTDNEDLSGTTVLDVDYLD